MRRERRFPGRRRPLLGARVHRDRVRAALERDDPGLRVEEAEAIAELAPQLEQPAVELEQRARVAALVLDVALLRVDDRQPRRTGREARLRPGFPLHRVAKPVAARAVERRVDAGAVREADLVALVDERG